MLIYGIKRKSDDKIVYVGQTVQTLKNRILRHKSDAKHNRDTILCKAFNKYGFDAFEFVVLEKVEKIEEIDELEQSYIKKCGTYPPCSGNYNMTSGGHNNHEFSNEYLQKLSNSQKKRYEDPNVRKEHSERMKKTFANDKSISKAKSELAKKRYNDPEERNKTGIATKKAFDNNPEIARKIGDATRRSYETNPDRRFNQSVAMKNNLANLEVLKKAREALQRKVLCVETGEIFDSIVLAAKQNSVAAPSISKSIKKGTRSNGYHFEYYNN